MDLHHEPTCHVPKFLIWCFVLSHLGNFIEELFRRCERLKNLPKWPHEEVGYVCPYFLN